MTLSHTLHQPPGNYTKIMTLIITEILYIGSSWLCEQEISDFCIQLNKECCLHQAVSHCGCPDGTHEGIQGAGKQDKALDSQDALCCATHSVVWRIISVNPDSWIFSNIGNMLEITNLRCPFELAVIFWCLTTCFDFFFKQILLYIPNLPFLLWNSSSEISERLPSQP